MPKVDFFLKQGESLPEGLIDILRRKFSQKELDKLLKFGGRIQISITAPFINKNLDKNFVVTEEFISKLKTELESTDSLLSTLSQKHLVEVAKRLGLPVKSKETVAALKSSLYAFLHSEEKWNKISGNENT